MKTYPNMLKREKGTILEINLGKRMTLPKSKTFTQRILFKLIKEEKIYLHNETIKYYQIKLNKK